MEKVNFISILVFLWIVLLLVNNAFAVLQDNGDGTVTQIRNDGSQLMWLKDMNTPYTTGYAPDGSNGQLFWHEAMAWIDSLNSGNYLGYSDWRLPAVSPVNGISFDINISYDGSTDSSFNISAQGSAYPESTSHELAYLYYPELGNVGEYDIYGNLTGCPPYPEYCLTNKGPFTIERISRYWSETASPRGNGIDFHFGFMFSIGRDADWASNHTNFATAVRDMPLVPEPISSILFLAGGTLLASRRYFKRK